MAVVAMISFFVVAVALSSCVSYVPGSRYGCDPTSMSCSLEWSLNTDFSSFVYNICLLVLGGIFPVTVM
jgi:hypothetical protein